MTLLLWLIIAVLLLIIIVLIFALTYQIEKRFRIKLDKPYLDSIEKENEYNKR